MTQKFRKLLCAILVILMVASLVPVSAFATSETTYVLAGSDFQARNGHDAGASIVSGLLAKIKVDYPTMDGFLFAGDYDVNYNDSANGKAKLQETVQSVYGTEMDEIYVQGNHDGDGLVGSTLTASGANDAENYGVFVINEKDYMWYNNDEATIKKTAANLETYLNAKRNAGYTKPIFVMSHLPLHYCMRTRSGGNDGMHANYIFDVLNEAGNAGLNIIFMFGHNHSHGWDDYLGGAAIFLTHGDKINIAQNSTTVFKEETLAFTYMNAGYVGYYGDSYTSTVDKTLTMTTFAITDENVIISRYDSNGTHDLKSAGVYNVEYPDSAYYSTDTTIVGTPYILTLNTEITPADEEVTPPSGGDSGSGTAGSIEQVTTLEQGVPYIIACDRTGLVLTGTATTNKDGNDSLLLSGEPSVDTTDLWYYDGTHLIYGDPDSTSTYLLMSTDTAYLGETHSYRMVDDVYLNDDGTTFTLKRTDDSLYLNQYGAGSSTAAAPYTADGNSDAGSKWRIYKVIADTDSGTEDTSGNNWVTINKPGDGSIKYIYELDTDGIDTGVEYMIVANSYPKAMSVAASSNNVVTIELSADEKNAYADSDTYGWTFTSYSSGVYYIRLNGSTYLRLSNGSLSSSTSTGSSRRWTVTNNNDGSYDIVYSGYNLRWSNSNGVFQASSSNEGPVRLYKYAGSGSSMVTSYIRLSGEIQQEYTVADAATLDTVLDKLVVQTSDDGVNVASEEIAVTTDMVTWDAAFDGKTAGTYTGTVTYEDKELGTVTVTITGAHEYETVTVEATCETDGSITTTCTVCGDETVEVIPATGHNYECVETEATCGQDGSKVYTCANCADTYTEVISATGEHSYESVTVDATCTEAGSVTHTCSGCGDTYAEVIAALGHTYSSVVTVPTCESEGYTTYTCNTCGHSYTDGKVDALGHDYDCVITATCTEAGYEVYTCGVCGHSYNGNAVAALGHNYESTVVAPGCATEGYTTYVCGVCGDTYTGDQVAALGHDYTAITVEATCTEAGYTTYTCKACGHSYVGDQVAALGHDYESVVTAPTFEEEGYTTHTCKVCGDVKVDSYVPVLQHTYETVTVDATCTEDGSITHTCVTCGYIYTEVLPALGHSCTTVTTEATCTKDGSVVNTCSVCGDEQTEVIPATGHNYTTSVIDPTCTEVGYKTYTCACGDVITEEIPATGHNYSAKYTAPTCTESGGTTYTCSACGDTYVETEAALGHTYTTESTAPTCTEAGYTTYTCDVCGDTYTADEVAALGHTYTGVVTEPSCTAEGYTTYTCSVCGDTYTADKIAALGHNYAQVVTEPTCTAAGYTTYTCTVCNDSYTGNTVAAKGHTYSCVESDGYLVYTCDACDDSYSEKIETVSYTKVSSISADNRYVITLYSGSKYYALSHANNQISAVQVTVSNDAVTSEITEDMIWIYADSKLSYEVNGTTYYLYAQPASGWWWWNWWSTPTLTISSSNSTTVSFSNSKLKMSNYYLRYSNGAVSLNSSATTTYFFEEG